MNKLAKYILVKQYPVDNAIFNASSTINEVSSTSKLYNHPLPPSIPSLFALSILYSTAYIIH